MRDLAVIADVDLLEEGLVEEATHLRGGGPVGGLAVAGQLKGTVQVLLDRLKLDGDGLKLSAGVVELPADASLLGLEEVSGQGVVVVQLQQLVALVVEAVDANGDGPFLGLGGPSSSGKGLLQTAAHGFELLLAERDARVVVLDEALHQFDGHHPL